MVRAVTAPYRDERETLRAENERLKSELARQRSPRPGVALGLLVSDFAAVLLLRPWLNGTSDWAFWCAVLILVSLTASAFGAALGFFPGRRR